MNRASQALQRLYPDRGSQVQLSKELQISQGHVSRLFRDERLPGTAVRKLFWKRKGIPMHWWDEPPEPEPEPIEATP